MELHLDRETILVVDDDLEIRALVKFFLERAGYAIATATDGEDGLNVFRSGRPRIALLLTDVRMPNMNGFDLADRVLELDSELPVLFMSGDASNASRGLGCVRSLSQRLSWSAECTRGWKRGANSKNATLARPDR